MVQNLPMGKSLLFGDLVFSAGDFLYGKPHPWVAREEQPLLVPPFCKNSALLPLLYPLAVLREHKHRPNGVSDVSSFLSHSASHAQMFCSLFLYSSQQFSLLLLLGHAFNASEAMIALRFSVWFIFFSISFMMDSSS